MKIIKVALIVLLTVFLIFIYSISFYLIADKITFEWALKTKQVSAAHILNINIYSRYIGICAGIIVNLISLYLFYRKPRVYYYLFVIHLIIASYLYYLIYIDQNYIFIPYIKDGLNF